MAGRRNLGSLFVSLELPTDKFNKSLSDAQKTMRKVGRDFTRVGQELATKVTLPLAAVGAISVKSFADFDDAMTRSTAIMGNLSAAMRTKLEAAARDVAKQTTFSAKETAEAYYFLASAGLDATQSMEALPAVAQFATAGMFDLSQATDLLTDAQSALGLTSKDAIENLDGMTRVSDVLVKANTLANASVEQFSLALTNKAGAALRGFGIEIETGVSALAAFADQGIKGEEAGTQLGIVLRDLTTKALQNKDAFAEYGVSVFDSAGEVRGFADIIGDLEGALDGMSDAQKKATLLTLGFTDKSVAALQVLVGTSQKMRDYESALRDAGGATQDVADKQLKSFTSQLKLAQGALQDVAIIIGERLAPVVGSIAGGLRDLADWFGSLNERWQEAIINAGVATGALSGLALVVGGLATLVGSKMLLGISAFTLAVGGLTVVFTKHKEVLQAVSLVIADFGLRVLEGAKQSALKFQIVIEQVFLGIKNAVFDSINAVNRQLSNFQIGLSAIGEKLGIVDSGSTFKLYQEITAQQDELTASTHRLEAAKLALVEAETRQNQRLEEFQGRFRDLAQSYYEVEAGSDGVAVASGEVAKKLEEVSEILAGGGASGGSSGGAKASVTQGADRASEALKSLEQQVKDLKRSMLQADLQEEMRKAFTAGDTARFDDLRFKLTDSIIAGLKEGFSDRGGVVSAQAEGLFSQLGEMQVGSFTDTLEAATINTGREVSYRWEGFFGEAFSAIGENFESDVGSRFANFGYELDSLIESLEKGSENVSDNLVNAFSGSAIGSVVGAISTLADNPSGPGQSTAWGAAIGTVLGGAVGAYFGGAGGAAAGASAGGSLGSVFGSFFENGQGDEEAQARQQIEDFLENVFSEDIIFGSRDRFEGVWHESFASIAGDGQNSFELIGMAMADLAGQSTTLGGQIGYILAENLNGNLDNARLLLQSLHVDGERLGEILLESAKSGEISWHKFEVMMQQVNRVTGEGLEAFGDLRGAYEQMIETGGKGELALQALRNFGVEAAEAGVEGVGELQGLMTTLGFSQEEIDRMITALNQRGIGSIDELGSVSDRVLGGIIADLESLGIEWGSFGSGIDEASENLKDLENRLDALEDKTVDVTVKVHYEEANDAPSGIDSASMLGNVFTQKGLEKFALGGVVNSPTLFNYSGGRGLMGEAGPEAILPLGRSSSGELGVKAGGAFGNVTNIVVNAPNATPGMERQIANAVKAAHRAAVRDSVNAVREMGLRGGL